MANEIILKSKSAVGSVPVPGDLDYGELALNYHEEEGALFYKNSNDNIRELSRHCGSVNQVNFVAAGTTTQFNLETIGDPRQWQEVYRFTMTRTSGTQLYMQCSWIYENGGGSGVFLAGRVVRDPDGTPIVTTGIVATQLEATAFNSTISGSRAAGVVPLNDNDSCNPGDNSMLMSSPHVDGDTAISGSTTYSVEIWSGRNFTGGNFQYIQGTLIGVEQ